MREYIREDHTSCNFDMYYREQMQYYKKTAGSEVKL